MRTKYLVRQYSKLLIIASAISALMVPPAGATPVFNVGGLPSNSMANAAMNSDNQPSKEGDPNATFDDAPDQENRNFWTPERMSQAQVSNQTVPDDGNKSEKQTASQPESETQENSEAKDEVDPFEQSTESSDPSQEAVDKVAAAYNGEPAESEQPAAGNVGRPKRYPTKTGALFFTRGGKLLWCGASVVQSENKRMIVTAGHCLYDPETQKWSEKVMFTPAHNGKVKDFAPLGSWDKGTMNVLPEWKNSGDMRHDVGFVKLRVGGDHNKRIEDVTGGYGLTWTTWTKGYSFDATIFGYPQNKPGNDGHPFGVSMWECTDRTYRDTRIWQSEVGQDMYRVDDCHFGDGSSGGPWLYRYNRDDDRGYVRSVTSGSPSNSDSEDIGPRFYPEVKTLLDSFGKK